MMDLRERIGRLSSEKRELLARRLEGRLDEPVPDGRHTLAAYVETHEHRTVTEEELRHWIAERLPEYMIPSSTVVLEALPRTATGKVDRRALAGVRAAAPDVDQDVVAPSTDVEKKLAEIWASVLGVDDLSVHDNFFELGGDSILSIRIIARANEAGFSFTPKQFFDHPTVAELVAMSGTRPMGPPPEREAAGPAPLTPIQHWFFENIRIDPHHWNQSVTLEIDGRLDTAVIERALRELVNHHDAFRLRFVPDGSGWTQEVVAPGPVAELEVVDLVEAPDPEFDRAANETEDRLHASFDLSRPPLLRAALLRRGPRLRDHLLLVVHHLVVDGVSWSILLEHLERVCRQLDRGDEPELPSPTLSFREWALRLEAHAQDERARADAPFWLADHAARRGRVPIDISADGPANTHESSDAVEVVLEAAETHTLLREASQAYRTRVDEMLLAALVRPIAGWARRDSLLVDVEGHGRDALPDEVDLSRSIGWFTSVYPVALDCAATADIGAALASIKEQLRRVPGSGAGHGILRHVTRDAAVSDALREQPRPEICFNYLGQDGPPPASPLFRRVAETRPSGRSRRSRRPYAIEIDARIVDDRLVVEWTYSTALHRRSTIERLAGAGQEALRSLIAHCTSGAGAATPSDFPLADLDADELGKIADLLSDPDDGDASS